MYKSKMLKTRIVSFFLAFVMLLGIIPVSVMATANAAGSVTLYVSSTAADDNAVRVEGAEYKTLQGAVDKAASGDTIILLTSTNEYSILIDNKNLTIDFNGNRVSCYSRTYAINPYGTTQLTLTDSSGNNSGGVDATGTSAVCIEVEDASKVTIESGSYVSKYGYCVETASGSTGQVIINGGSVTAVSSCVYNDSSKAKIFLNGGTFSGNIYGGSGGVLLTPEVLDRVYGKNRIFNNIYIHFPSGSNKLTKDLDLHDWQLRVLEGEDTTIDLNGFNITGNGMENAPSDGGTVVIGDINNLSCLIQVHETGKLTFKNTGAHDESHGRIHNDATPLIYIIKNYGELTLDGNLRIDARLTSSGEYTQSGAVYMYSTFNSTDDTATLTVNNGVDITAKKADATTTYFTNGILVGSASNGNGNYADRIKTTINGGNIYGDYYAMSLAGTLTINGGTFKNSDTATSEVFYIGYPVANLTGISNASFIGKSIAMYIGDQAFQSDTITLHNTTINQSKASPITTAIAQQGETKNVIITGKDTYWVANALTLTNDYCKGTIKIRSGIFSTDPTSYVPATGGAKDYAVLNYTNTAVSDYFLVAPWTKVGTDNMASLYYPANATDTDTASDDVSIVALNDTESIIPDATRVQTRHFTLSSDANTFTGIDGLSVTAFSNGNRLTVQKTKACNATEAYVWYGGRNVGKIIIETKSDPTYDVGGEITDAIGKPTAYLIRDGVKYNATITGADNPYQYVVTGVPAGTYNLVVSSATSITQTENIITTTVLVEIIDRSIAQNVVLPQSVYNSIVTTDGKKTPNVEAGGLDDMAKTVGASDAANTYVLIELKVAENENSDNAGDVKAAITGDGMIKGIIMDTDVLKTVNKEKPVKITEIDQNHHGVSLVTVVFHLPENLQGKDSYAIFRYHGDKVEKITENVNSNGEYMTVNSEKNTITAYLNKFSTYSIAYTEKYTVTYDANGGSVTPISTKTNAENKLDALPTPTRSGNYRFDGWYTSADGGTEVTTATVFTSDSTIYAHWTYRGDPDSFYTITPKSGEGGQISPNRPITVKGGNSTGFTMVPDKGYDIRDVKVDGKSVGAVKEYIFTNVRSDHTIEVSFEKATPTLKPQPDKTPDKPLNPDQIPDKPLKPDQIPDKPLKPDPTPDNDNPSGKPDVQESHPFILLSALLALMAVILAVLAILKKCTKKRKLLAILGAVAAVLIFLVTTGWSGIAFANLWTLVVALAAILPVLVLIVQRKEDKETGEDDPQ